jgi:glucose-6-phosphate 1-dehydrogenase
VRNPDPCVLVIFGASGDLTARKLIPALYEMRCTGALPAAFKVLGVSRRAKSDDAWRDELAVSAREHANNFDDAKWREFASCVHYFAGDAAQPEMYGPLKARLAQLDEAAGTRGNRLFYLSVAPELYEAIVQRIDEAELVTEGKKWCSIDRAARSWQRIIIEKPFGHDEASAASLNRSLGRVFEEEAIYRIDHYLGKEVVQAMLVLRFANTMFEPIWNHRYIDHVQITASETVGVGNRTAFYDKTGAIRDMIQSHLLQIFAFVAMEPPTAITADDIRAEKIKAVRAIRPTVDEEIASHAVLGQYAGDGQEGAYAALDGVAKGSTTETFAALKLHVDNWRWAGTPFYVRTGKRMARKRTEIVVQFKAPAANLFRATPHTSGEVRGNRLVIEIAPSERTRLRFESKVPGTPLSIGSVEMQVDFDKEFGVEPLEAYGPLLVDAMRGDQSLYKHRLEVEGGWAAVMPFLAAGASAGAGANAIRKGIASNYAPGSWGPAGADEMMRRDGRAWHND